MLPPLQAHMSPACRSFLPGSPRNFSSSAPIYSENRLPHFSFQAQSRPLPPGQVLQTRTQSQCNPFLPYILFPIPMPHLLPRISWTHPFSGPISAPQGLQRAAQPSAWNLHQASFEPGAAETPGWVLCQGVAPVSSANAPLRPQEPEEQGICVSRLPTILHRAWDIVGIH